MPLRRRKARTMTQHTQQLKPEHLDPDNPLYVPDELRPHYETGPATETETEARLTDKQWLARHIQREERARARATATGERLAPAGMAPGIVDPTRARREPTPGEWAQAEQRTRDRADQGWTDELRAAWLHEHRLARAAAAHADAERQAAGIRRNTCAVCQQYRPGVIVTDRLLATGHRARTCEACERVVAIEHDRRLAAQTLDGLTRSQRVAAWLDANAPTR